MKPHEFLTEVGINREEDWRVRAACRGTATPDDWFPHHTTSRHTHTTVAALTVCQSCPVRKACYTAGDGQQGIWGGSTEEQRNRLTA